eukprot:2088829-Pyramimonas_sp.AAC.1
MLGAFGPVFDVMPRIQGSQGQGPGAKSGSQIKVQINPVRPYFGVGAPREPALVVNGKDKLKLSYS